jgi:hypothetical protein
MRLLSISLALLLIGCGGNAPPAKQGAAPTGGADQKSTDKTGKSVAWDKPEFVEMIKALKANPADPQYKGLVMLHLEMTLDSKKEINKENYEVTGKVGPVNVRTTFFVPPNSLVNSQIKILKPGDKVNFFCKLDSLTAGDPRPELRVRDPSIMSVDQADK